MDTNIYTRFFVPVQKMNDALLKCDDIKDENDDSVNTFYNTCVKQMRMLSPNIDDLQAELWLLARLKSTYFSKELDEDKRRQALYNLLIVEWSDPFKFKRSEKPEKSGIQ